MGKRGKATSINSYYKPYRAGKKSIFTIFPISRDIRNKSFTKWELLTDYMKRKFITRKQAKKLAELKYIAVSSFRNRLYVCELCLEEINQWLS